MLIRISRPRRGSLALVLLHAWAWLEKLFFGARGRSAGKEGKKKNQALFSIARGQSAGKEGKKLFRPQKVLFSIARGRSAGKEGKTTFQAPKSFIFYRQRPVSRQGRKKKLFRPQKVLFSIARGQSAGKEGKKTFQAPKSCFFYRQRPVSRQGRKKTFQAPKSFIFYRQRPVSQQARKEKKLFRPPKVLFSIARGSLRGLTAAEAVGFRVAPEEHCISAIMSEMSPHKCKKRKDRSDSDLKSLQETVDRGKKKTEAEQFFSLGLDPGKKAHKLLSSFELTR